MPSLYAHNKFGKKVLKNMSPMLKNIIRSYPDSFRLGLQGPDTLFFFRPLYKNRINQTGVSIHKQDAYPFFDDAISIITANGFDSACHAYLLGFICHFALDHAAHPYVYKAMEETGCGHIEIEGDFENYLLSMDNKVPEKYRMDKLIPSGFYVALSAAPFYENISPLIFYSAMKHMKLVKRFFVAPGRLKRNFIKALMHASLHYNYFNGHMILPDANKKCRHCSEHLYEIFNDTVPVALRLIDEFESGLVNGLPLPDDFHGNFNGDGKSSLL